MKKWSVVLVLVLACVTGQAMACGKAHEKQSANKPALSLGKTDGVGAANTAAHVEPLASTGHAACESCSDHAQCDHADGACKCDHAERVKLSFPAQVGQADAAGAPSVAPKR